MTPGPGPSAGEIAELLRRLRALSEPGRHVDPAERAAVLAAKDALLARILASTRRDGPAPVHDEDTGMSADHEGTCVGEHGWAR